MIPTAPDIEPLIDTSQKPVVADGSPPAKPDTYIYRVVMSCEFDEES